MDLIKGKYSIVREIARSNDIVYEAQDTKLGRRIALKELNIAPGMTGQARRERIERFNREARAAGRLSHPNIVSVFDFGEENGRHFIAMEFLEGQNLRDLLQLRGVLAVKEALDIACQILDALAYAHTNRVIHRDIKPDNIQILPGGQVKLTDFGIARLTEEPSLTSNGQVFGTPSYMSPEQIEGRAIDHRSDLFSLGVVLYEMLTGRKPFIGDSVISITYAVMHAEPPPMAGVPTGIEQVIRRALSKHPDQRQASAIQLRTDLRNAEATPPLFLPQQSAYTNSTHMGHTGMNGNMPSPMGGNMSGSLPGGPIGGNLGGYPNGLPMPSQLGGAPGMPGYPSNYTGANVGYGVPAPGNYNIPTPMPVQPASNAPAGGNLAWSWNTPGNVIPSPAPGQPANMPPSQAGVNIAPGPLTNAGGVFPYASPPFPARPPEPLFVLSPGARTTLLALLAAVVVGGLVAFGVIFVIHKYDEFKVNVGAQQVTALIAQGNAAYNRKDFAEAAKLLEQALAADAAHAEYAKIQTELGYTYVELARSTRKNGNIAEAINDYQKAISYSPDYATARTELSVLLESQGDHNGAREQREAVGASAADSSAAQEPPASFDGHVQPLNGTGGNSAGGPAQDPNQFLNDNRAAAAQLIQEGDTLQAQGNLDGARQKWTEAVSKGAGFPERDEAQQRLDKTAESPNFGN